MHSVLNALSEYTYFYISKNITSCTFLVVFKIVESLQCILKSIKRNKAARHDDIDTNIIIEVYDGISYPLFMIFDSSFSEGIFPELLKVANVSPILKVGSTEEVENYRLISVLPIYSLNC